VAAKTRVPDVPVADAAGALLAGFGKREALAFAKQQMDYWTHAQARNRVDSAAAYEYWRGVHQAIGGQRKSDPRAEQVWAWLKNGPKGIDFTEGAVVGRRRPLDGVLFTILPARGSPLEALVAPTPQPVGRYTPGSYRGVKQSAFSTFVAGLGLSWESFPWGEGVIFQDCHVARYPKLLGPDTERPRCGRDVQFRGT